MYYLQHERTCCIGYTNSSRRREFVYPIQHGRECCKWFVKFQKYVFKRKRILRYVYLRACLYDPTYPGLNKALNDFEVLK